MQRRVRALGSAWMPTFRWARATKAGRAGRTSDSLDIVSTVLGVPVTRFEGGTVNSQVAALVHYPDHRQRSKS